MVVCIPVTRDEGLESPVSAHFGSAPFFMLADDEAGTLRAIANRNQHHAHGQCQPLAAVEGERVNAIVVGGIGRGALAKLQAAGVEVLWSNLPTVEETLRALSTSGLRRVALDQTCGGHSADGGCAH